MIKQLKNELEKEIDGLNATKKIVERYGKARNFEVNQNFVTKVYEKLPAKNYGAEQLFQSALETMWEIVEGEND